MASSSKNVRMSRKETDLPLCRDSSDADWLHQQLLADGVRWRSALPKTTRLVVKAHHLADLPDVTGQNKGPQDI